MNSDSGLPLPRLSETGFFNQQKTKKSINYDHQLYRNDSEVGMLLLVLSRYEN